MFSKTRENFMRPSTPIPDSRIQELKDFRKKKWPGNEFLRFLCVWLRVDKGMATTKIAEVLNWNVNTVRRIQKGFIDHGTEVLIESKKGGRQHQLMTLEAEKTFLSEFMEKANKGLILVIREIKDALEKHVGHKVHKTTVYRMLYRHGWRKVVPRKSHPKRDKEAGEGFKKRASPNG
jgi:transposase